LGLIGFVFALRAVFGTKNGFVFGFELGLFGFVFARLR
jgi:hypothetical protein